MKIAVDAMGGDFAPQNIVEGACHALRDYADISRIFLVGDQSRVEAQLKRLAFSDSRLEIVHASEVITMDDSPVLAVRRKKDSSMSRAIDLVKHGQADAVVSAGNTGALLTAAHLKLRTLEGVKRPGLACLMPAPRNVFVLMDAGANLEPDAQTLVQYAFMASLVSRQLLGYEKPRVAVFSIGTEEMKGNDLTLEVHRILKETELNFVGNVDGHDLFDNKADVIITDAFVGNAVLKSCESTARAVKEWLKEEMTRTPLRKLGALLASGAFKALRKKLDPDMYGGAILLGVNGVCIKAHGAASPLALQNAIRIAGVFVKHDLNQHIVADINRLNAPLQKIA
jgi:glycerol-3-phosphate acyltransferase PlsX